MKRNRKIRLWPVVLILIICWLAFASPKPAPASSGDTLIVTAVPIGSVAVVAAASYKSLFSTP